MSGKVLKSLPGTNILAASKSKNFVTFPPSVIVKQLFMAAIYKF
jgi:hypothetical protein